MEGELGFFGDFLPIAVFVDLDFAAGLERGSAAIDAGFAVGNVAGEFGDFGCGGAHEDNFLVLERSDEEVGIFEWRSE